VVLSVAASDIHHVSAVRLANCNSRVRADCDTELFLSRLPESMADALDSKSGADRSDGHGGQFKDRALMAERVDAHHCRLLKTKNFTEVNFGANR
jgi:hypothetical protein